MVMDVLAAGVNQLDLAKASGAFYAGPPALPSVVGKRRCRQGWLTVAGCSSTRPSRPTDRGQQSLVNENDVLDVADDVPDAVAAAQSVRSSSGNGLR
jgi:hypothetical protein